MASGVARAAVLVAAVELRRSVRSLAARRSQLLGIGVGLLLFGGGAAVVSYLLVALSPDLSALTLGPAIRGAVAFQWLFASALFVQRVVTVHSRPDAEAFLLTTVRPEAVVSGLVLAETGRALAYVGLPALLVGSALAFVAGSPATVALVALAVGALLATAALTGHVVGFAIKLAVARVPAVARNRTVLGAVGVTVVFGGYAVVQMTGGATTALGLLPVGWLVDVALSDTPVGTSRPHAAGALAFVGGWLVAGGAAASWLATQLWFGDSVESVVEREAAAVGRAGDDPLAAGLGWLWLPPVGSRPTRRVAQRSMLLVRRAPAKATYLVVFPAAALGPLAVRFVAGEATLPLGAVAPLLAVLVPWVAGGAFGLNPLGDEGAVLPATLTSLASGRQYVRGLVLPALTVGLPLSALPPAAALATGASVPVAALLALSTVGGVVVAALVAPGIGFLFPRTEAVRVARGRELVPPTLTAMALYSAVVAAAVGVPAAAAFAPAVTRGVAALVVGGPFAFPFDLAGGPAVAAADGLRAAAGWLSARSVATVRWAGVVGPLAGGVALGLLAARLARRRYERYAL
jgi:hypothetical protein